MKSYNPETLNHLVILTVGDGTPCQTTLPSIELCLKLSSFGPERLQSVQKWCAEKNVQVYSENVLLAYFSENAKNYKSSTLWAQYSMVKSCLIIYDNIDISKFPKLIAFFKRTGDGYQAKKIENIDKE
ncbi:hypothetical protein NQ317_016302 [Molorchus minor]|uniref:Uncharacterized protein n=1 Tax=Molorchus minor TaxID=1323400 RepID=A0ABQ9K5A5_9CUCU|nr:hypothetical protein NQ317_016302 [Molorchus minor]